MSGIFKELPENNKKERSQLINREKVRTGGHFGMKGRVLMQMFLKTTNDRLKITCKR